MHYQRLLILLISLLFYSVIKCQSLQRPLAAAYPGLGAYSTRHADIFSFHSNQASLARLVNISMAVYAERRFMLKELGLYHATFGVVTPSGNFGLAAGYFGYSDFNATKLGLAYARSLGKKMDAGLQFNYNAIRISGYGKSSAISFELGTIFHLTEKLHTGLHVSHPATGMPGKTMNEKPAAVYTTGMGYDASEKFFVGAEIEKEENQPVSVNAGFQYKIVTQLIARVGFTSSTSVFYSGIGFFFKSIRLDVVTGYHPYAGITPGILIVYDFKSAKKDS